jgi:hypothetical protein
VRKLLELLAQQFDSITLAFPQRVPAVDRAMLLILLAEDRKLIRDREGYWNRRRALTDSTFNGDPVKVFNTGCKDKTIEKLIESNLVLETKFDGRGRPIEVVWRGIN